ncbi:hypothetical protein ONS95_006151 [Cadophora gregata]|uniref:uncharacterized protein n=1 Tax=Cadophora gregata TaxID=51156 RepID=UPI0026DC124B|nr:uncharacterized protein ONS95_006151 [Cadophora gregata]KAK0102538.1 hypothetical protein ONS95_006151 [Cadophora gregata]
MSFGWSAGDVIAGLKAVWEIWQAVSDGPLNARFEAAQFFDEFIHVTSRLSEWEARRLSFMKDDRLHGSHQELRDQCTDFIKKHMSIIQRVNPNTKAIRSRRSTWIQRATFTQSQVIALYQQVQWPSERKAVTRLREKLQFFLEIAAFDVGLDTNAMVRDMKASQSSHADLLSTNLRLVSSHLDLVNRVTLNLKLITYPLEQGNQAREIDYPILRQFEQALHPPQPIRAIEQGTQAAELPWQNTPRLGETEYAAILPPNTPCQDQEVLQQNEVRGLISQRLDNLSMRVKRVETMDTISELGTSEIAEPSVNQLLKRLQDMRGQIAEAVGVLNHSSPQNDMSVAVTEPRTALQQELEAWNKLEERIERERLHPPIGIIQPPTPPRPIPIPSPRSSGSLSPMTSPFDGWSGPTYGSPDRNRGSLSSSPGQPRPLSHSRTHSTSSISRRQSFGLDRQIPVQLSYLDYRASAVIQSITRFDTGDVEVITTTSMDGMIRFKHTIDVNTPSLVETSMKPFLDNSHIDKTHKLRVQFQGSHTLKITKQNEKPVTLPFPPVYKFINNEAGLFKSPRQPTRKSKSLTLESSDGKAPFLAKSLSRRSTQGSVATIASFESSAGPAYARIDQRSGSGSGKPVRGLMVEFCEADECLGFWNEFVKKDVDFADIGLGQPALPVELPA